MAPKHVLPFIIAAGLPVLFALTLPFFFRHQLFTDPLQPGSLLAMVGLPFTEGLLLVAASSAGSASYAAYRVFMPWVAVLVFFLVTFMFGLEDCACWLIGLPVYLLFSSLGGVTAGYFRQKKSGNAGEPIP